MKVQYVCSISTSSQFLRPPVLLRDDDYYALVLLNDKYCICWSMFSKNEIIFKCKTTILRDIRKLYVELYINCCVDMPFLLQALAQILVVMSMG